MAGRLTGGLRRSRRLWLSMLLFAVALALPAFRDVRASQAGLDASPAWVVEGWLALGIGWFPALFGLIGIPQGQFEFLRCMAWFANPMLLACWVCMALERRSAAVVLGSAALGLSLIFVLCHDLPITDGNTNHQVVPGLGCWLWMTSILVAIAGAAFAGRSESPSYRDPTNPSLPPRD